MSISKIEAMKIIDLLNDFQKMCETRDIKFGSYTEDELYEFLRMYRAYKLSGEPPF